MLIDDLYIHEYENLVRLAARRVGRERAEDAVQSAFVELLQGEVQEDPLRFLTRRAQNIARRETKRESERSQLELGGSTGRKKPAGVLDPVEPVEYQAGGLFGFPYNRLGESTWS